MADIKTEKQPIFIVGGQRSGTTMLRLMLNAHPHIAVPFESDFIPKFNRRLDEYGDLADAANVERLLGDIAEQPFVKKGHLVRNPETILALRPKSYRDLVAAIYETYAKSEGKQRWGDKDPDNVLQIDVLWSLFPGCRIVHIVRDGRGVANSLRKLEWGSKNLLKLAQDWSWQVTLGRKMGMMVGPRYYLEIKYEDLVRAPEPLLRNVCEFLDEPFDHRMLRYHETAVDAIPEASLKYHASSIQAPDPEKSQAWRREMGLADQVLFEEVAGHTLEEFGYQIEAHRSSWGSNLMKLKYTLINRW